jgi:tryptophan-rich sensory protein
MDSRTIFAAIGILFVFVYAFGSGIWVSSSPEWYASLRRPPWQPPSYVIGIIWPYNFMILGIASYQVSKSLTRLENMAWLAFFGLSIFAAIMWAYQFYSQHNFTFATIALVSAALLTLPLLYLAFKASWIMGLLLVPYQIWVAIAASLAWGYLTRN